LDSKLYLRGKKMSEEQRKESKRPSINTTKEITDLAKKKAKGKGVTFRPYTEDLKTRLAQVEEKRGKIIVTPGSEKLLAKHRKMGKITARERIDLFFDEGTFVEHGIFAESQIKDMGMDKYYTPSDGVVVGYGEVNGRMVCAYATDYTVLAGSGGEGHQSKIADITELAGEMRVPIVGLIDSAGARLGEAAACLKGWFRTYWLQSNLSGVIPQIMIICGGCAAGQAYSPLLTDFIIMDRNQGTNMWLGGPRATAAVTTAEDISAIGGADYHMKVSGSCHFAVETDKDAIETAKKILSYLPSNSEEQAPYLSLKDDPHRREEKLLDILPKDPRRSYDMHDIISLIVDNGEFLEIQEDYSKSSIVGFARFNGYSCGIYAGNPAYISGCLCPDACDKVTRFVIFCDAFNIPIIYLVDTPAITVGEEWERTGNIRHCTKLLNATMTATVPKIGILVRKAYGGTLPIFLAKPFSADFVYTWPSGEYAPMGPDGAVAIIYDRQIRELPTSEERLAFAEAKKKEYFDLQVDVIKIAANLRWDYIDDIIDPRRTREVIVHALKLANSKKAWKIIPRKRGNPPV
jgi:acetyl-CoA carboxylase carboxyltransferase component